METAIYDLYKPLRNRLRQYPLIESLWVIRSYIQNLQHGDPFPQGIETPSQFVLAQRPNTFLHQWELSLLAKELLINAPEAGGRSLRAYAEIRDALNLVKNLENEIMVRYPLIGEDILLEVYRISHRQFPWQTAPSTRSLVRYFKIFSTEPLREIFERRIGMSPSSLYTLGLSVTGHFLSSFVLKLPMQTKPIGLPKECGERFISLFAADVQSLRERALALQSYDHDYAYTLNPLQFHPLIKVFANGQASVIAPVTDYLLRRFTDGVFYDLCNEVGFSDAFGEAFQTYIGDVIEKARLGSELTVLPECEFHDGKDRKDSIDWIASDPTGHIFIECKTKRLRAEAKVLIASTDALASELDKIAAAVAQTYKAIVDAEAGLYPHWLPDGGRIYPLVVTLEDWYAWGDRILGPISQRVEAKLVEAGIDPTIINRCPYTICSVAEFETSIQIISKVGLSKFMSSKVDGDSKTWALHSYNWNSFREDARLSKATLFPEALKRISPVLGKGR